MTEPFILSLFVYPHFLYTSFPLCDCLYREKDVSGGLCHSHISHLVDPKTMILDNPENPKNDRKFSQIPSPTR